MTQYRSLPDGTMTQVTPYLAMLVKAYIAILANNGTTRNNFRLNNNVLVELRGEIATQFCLDYQSVQDDGEFVAALIKNGGDGWPEDMIGRAKGAANRLGYKLPLL